MHGSIKRWSTHKDEVNRRGAICSVYLREGRKAMVNLVCTAGPPDAQEQRPVDFSAAVIGARRSWLDYLQDSKGEYFQPKIPYSDYQLNVRVE